MMVRLRWEGLVARVVGHGAVEQMRSMNLSREEERVPKRFAERRISLAFSKQASGVYLLFLRCSAWARGRRGVLWFGRWEGAQGLRRVTSSRCLTAR